MQAEEAVEIDDAILAGARDGERRPHLVVRGFAVRHDDVEAVGGAALEDHDEALAAAAGLGGAVNRARKKAG